MSVSLNNRESNGIAAYQASLRAASAQMKQRAVRLAVRRLIEAEVADSWKGGGDPADIPDIEDELIEARVQFEEALKEIA